MQIRFELAVELGLGLGLELTLGIVNCISLFLLFLTFSVVNRLAKSDWSETGRILTPTLTLALVLPRVRVEFAAKL